MNDLREVDLERGMPRAEQAIRQMLFELRRSPGLGCSAVKLNKDKQKSDRNKKWNKKIAK